MAHFGRLSPLSQIKAGSVVFMYQNVKSCWGGYVFIKNEGMLCSVALELHESSYFEISNNIRGKHSIFYYSEGGHRLETVENFWLK